MKNWRLTTLGEIADIEGGSTPRRDVMEYWDGDIPWVTPTDLPMPGDGIATISSTHEKITAKGLNSISAKLLPPGTVLFSSRATIGKIGISGIPLVTNQGFANLKPKPGIDARFLAYSLWHFTPQISQLAGSTTFREVTKGTLRQFEIPLPPLAEQQRIVQRLDEADALRKLRAQADARTADLIPALFNEMFGDPATNSMGWIMRKLGDITKVKTGGTPSRKIDDFYRNGLIPWVKTTEVNGQVIFDTEERITQQGLMASNCELFPAGTLILAMYGQGATRGRSAKLGIPATTNQACAAILPTELSDPDYLWCFLQMSYLLLRDLGHGGNQKNMNLEIVKSIKLPLPPLSLQRTFAARVAEVRALQAQQARSRQRLDDLFQSMLHRAFS